MTIEAWDFAGGYKDYEIDAINKSIVFPETVNKDNIVDHGTNGIGLFSFSYRVQNLNSTNTFECSIDSFTTTVTLAPLPTSSTCNESVPIHNSTDQPLAVSSSSLWALIAVAITLLLTLLVTIIIAICVVRNMSMKLKETKERNARARNGEHTCSVYIKVLLSRYIF